MTKQEFLNHLEKELHWIAEEERKDILMEYGTYIDDKMASGCKEEEAVQGFGDVHELGKEILEAYKIDTNTVHTKMDRTLDKVYSRSESFLNKAGNLSMNDMFHLLFDAFVLLLILSIGKFIIIDLFMNFFIQLLFFFAGGYLYGFERIVKIFFSLIYFVISVFFFISIMVRRFDRYKIKGMTRVGVMEDIKSTWNQEAKELIPGHERTADLPPIPNQTPLYHDRTVKSILDARTKDVLIKILLLIISIPLLLVFIGFVVALICLFYITIVKQAYSIGIYLIIFGCIGGITSLLWLLIILWPKGGHQDA